MILKPAWPPEYPELSSARLSMRPPIEEDSEMWRELRRRNKVHLQPFEPSWPHNALLQSFFTRRLRYQKKEWLNDRSYSFFVFLNGNSNADTDKTLVGGMNINNVSRGAAQFASLGYWIDKDHQNQGLMGEVLELSLKFSFSYLNLERINAATLVDNIPSQRVLIRAGFEEEGFAKAYIQINGMRHDHKLYGLNKADWAACV
jgi:ribosomal-protein-alanine N-acetyltransferase